MDTGTDLHKHNLIPKPECPQIFLSNLWTHFHVLSRDAAEASAAGKKKIKNYCSYENKFACFLQGRISKVFSSLSIPCAFCSAKFLLCAPQGGQGPCADQGPHSCLLCSSPPTTSHTTSLQYFLQGWPTQLKKNLKISFLIMYSLTASWDESALRYQKGNVALSGQKSLNSLLPQCRDHWFLVLTLIRYFWGRALPACEWDKVTWQWHRGSCAGKNKPQELSLLPGVSLHILCEAQNICRNPHHIDVGVTRAEQHGRVTGFQPLTELPVPLPLLPAVLLETDPLLP